MCPGNFKTGLTGLFSLDLGQWPNGITSMMRFGHLQLHVWLSLFGTERILCLYLEDLMIYLWMHSQVCPNLFFFFNSWFDSDFLNFCKFSRNDSSNFVGRKGYLNCQMSSLLSFEINILSSTGECLLVSVEIVLKVLEFQF